MPRWFALYNCPLSSQLKATFPAYVNVFIVVARVSGNAPLSVMLTASLLDADFFLNLKQRLQTDHPLLFKSFDLLASIFSSRALRKAFLRLFGIAGPQRAQHPASE